MYLSAFIDNQQSIRHYDKAHSIRSKHLSVILDSRVPSHALQPIINNNERSHRDTFYMCLMSLISILSDRHDYS